MAQARALINGFAGSRRLLPHALITPAQQGWMDEVDKAIAVHKPESWKGYTIGDPLNPSKFPWRLDDEKLVYPFYEKAVKAGITKICIHKGLLPPGYEKSYANVWRYVTAEDIGKAAKDWPQMKFVMYHDLPASGLRTARPGPDGVRADRPHPLRKRPCRHPAEIRRRQRPCRARHGLRQLGSVESQVLRRLESPEDMRKKYGFAALGDANSMTKQMIFANNALAMYGIKLKATSNTQMPAYSEDRFAALKKEHALASVERSNLRYGFVRAD